MHDLISRQAAIDVLEERLRANGYSNVALVSELNRSIGYLMRLPSAEPEPKRGKWIPQDHNKSNGFVTTAVYYFPKCSECGKSGEIAFAFCPYCGARMDGGRIDHD